MSVRTAGEQASEAIGHASIHHRTWLWDHLNGTIAREFPRKRE
jgi:hypothetical protein